MNKDETMTVNLRGVNKDLVRRFKSRTYLRDTDMTTELKRHMAEYVRPKRDPKDEEMVVEKCPEFM